ncbi:MAG: AzlD domain-containing protein [Rhodospirillaceae bacterium]|nr:AzlD domain-containing protein [Rhodospirillaceae bacterium]
MNGFDIPEWAIIWAAIAVSGLATYASRFLGVIFSGRVRADGKLVEWVASVTYALLAGLVARMIILPIGSLNAATDWMRLAATAAGLAAFFAFGRSVAAGVITGTLALIIMLWQ